MYAAIIHFVRVFSFTFVNLSIFPPLCKYFRSHSRTACYFVPATYTTKNWDVFLFISNIIFYVRKFKKNLYSPIPSPRLYILDAPKYVFFCLIDSNQNVNKIYTSHSFPHSSFLLFKISLTSY